MSETIVSKLTKSKFVELAKIFLSHFLKLFLKLVFVFWQRITNL
jgi:hypothetical protein